MSRKQNKIQGVVSDEMLAQWQQWKDQQGFKSDGQALNALLHQFFSGGDTEMTSDQATQNKLEHLENRIEALENQLSQIITSDSNAKNTENTGDDNQLSPVITVAPQDENRDRMSRQQSEPNRKTEYNQNELEKGLTQKELATRWNITPRAISDAKKKKDHSDWEKYCQKYDPDGFVWYVSGRKYYPSKHISN